MLGEFSPFLSPALHHLTTGTAPVQCPPCPCRHVGSTQSLSVDSPLAGHFDLWLGTPAAPPFWSIRLEARRGERAGKLSLSLPVPLRLSLSLRHWPLPLVPVHRLCHALHMLVCHGFISPNNSADRPKQAFRFKNWWRVKESSPQNGETSHSDHISMQWPTGWWQLKKHCN